MHMKVFITIVLCLAVFNFQSVMTLKTGYKYKSARSVNKFDVYDDLNCMHLFSGLLHMQLTGYLLTPNWIIENPNRAADVIDMMSWYNAGTGVYTMYVLDKSKIGALWLLHLYTSIVRENCDFYSRDVTIRQKAITVAKIRSTNQYFIKLLQKEIETEDCRPGNFFDRYDKWMKYHNWLPEVRHVKQAICDNYKDFEVTTEANIQKLPPGVNYESFNLRELLMNDFGNDDYAKLDLMNVYNVQVNWADTTVHLQNAWIKTKELDWKSSKLQTIKKYYSWLFDFLKVIFLRLTLKHLLYIERLPAIVQCITRVSYLEQWHHLVIEFGKMLHISDEPHIVGLLWYLSDLTNPQETIKNAKLYLETILDLICNTLGCVMTSSMDLDGQEFKVPYKGMNQDIAVYMQTVSGQEPVERNSLANAKAFMLHLTKIFINVDFSVIHLLIEYINTVFK